MKRRVLSNWSFLRLLYAVMGAGLLYYSVTERQWLGIIIALYFLAMCVFAIGCATGNFVGDECEVEGNS